MCPAVCNILIYLSNIDLFFQKVIVQDKAKNWVITASSRVFVSMSQMSGHCCVQQFNYAIFFQKHLVRDVAMYLVNVDDVRLLGTTPSQYAPLCATFWFIYQILIYVLQKHLVMDMAKYLAYVADIRELVIIPP